MEVKNLFPYVVPESYFAVPDDLPVPPSPDMWGIVRPIGHGVFNMLTDTADGVNRNVQLEDLEELGLTPEEAEKAALDNLSRRVNDGKSYTKQLARAPSGASYIVWMGDFLAASCCLWPGLFEWAKGPLNIDKILISIPQVQLMFLMAPGDAAFRAAMRQYIAKAVENLDKQITPHWFALTAEGLTPFFEENEQTSV